MHRIKQNILRRDLIKPGDILLAVRRNDQMLLACLNNVALEGVGGAPPGRKPHKRTPNQEAPEDLQESCRRRLCDHLLCLLLRRTGRTVSAGIQETVLGRLPDLGDSV